MTYWFVSHSSADNNRLAPVVKALLDSGVPLWFDRPYDLDIATGRFAGNIRQGEPWTQEILSALVGACGVVCFPSEAFRASDECRLEVALGRTFGLATHYKIVPILLAEDSWKFLDARISGTQGMRIHVSSGDTGTIWSLVGGAGESVKDLADLLKSDLAGFAPNNGALAALYRRFSAAASDLNRTHSQTHAATPVKLDEDNPLLYVAGRYRAAATGNARTAIDKSAFANQPLALATLRPLLTGVFDESLGIAAAVGLARAQGEESETFLSDVAAALLRSDSARVRSRVANSLKSRTDARLITAKERPQLVCVIEVAVALERNPEVERALTLARDHVSGSR